jgi:hypothetical protein
MDDNQKKLIPQLAIYTKFFHSAFVNSYTMQNQKCSRSGVRLSVHMAIESLIANYCMSWRWIFKGLSQDGGQADFSKNLRDTSFYKDLSNESNFGLINLAGQYL